MPVPHPFIVVPPLRCDWRPGAGGSLPCGARATAIRFSPGDLPIAFRCASHLEPGDQAIPMSYLCRRVTLHADVLFAGVSLGLTAAKAEAVARLELAVESVGGLLNLHSAESDLGRYSRPESPLRRAGVPYGI